LQAVNIHGANGLLHLKLKNFDVAHTLIRLFTPALNILLKWLEMGVRLNTQMNCFNNIY